MSDNLEYTSDLLIVDDAVELCGAFKSWFKDHGITTDCCFSIEDFKKNHQNKLYKVALIDWVLGEKERGWEIIPLLDKRIKPIFMSGYIHLRYAALTNNTNIDFYEKPFSDEVLNELVAKIKAISSETNHKE